MKITELGHCCLIIEEAEAKILTDPGDYTEAQNSVRGLTHVFITHEHQDHFHVPSLKQVLVNNPGAKVYTNSAVGNLLVREGINYELLEHGNMQVLAGVEVEGIGADHHLAYKNLPIFRNTGYLFAGKFFYPGDSFTDPKKSIKLLALPISGPWLSAAEAFDYAQLVKPDACFPVHDGNMLRRATLYRFASKVLESAGIKFLPVEEGRIEYDI